MNEMLGPRHEAVARLLEPDDASALGDFFERLARDSDADYFRPHPLTREYAAGLSRMHGRDIYLVSLQGDVVVGYAMLRGWDEGYEIPAFGVAVDERARGRGVGRSMLRCAVVMARERGAASIMLKVHPENARARALYESEGFVFGEELDEAGQLRGYLAL